MSTFYSANFTKGNILLKEHNETKNNKTKLHILRVAMNKLGNWLIAVSDVIALKLKMLITQHTDTVQL